MVHAFKTRWLVWDGNDPSGGAPNGAGDPPANGTPPQGGEEKTFTQADLDRIVSERLAREGRKDDKAIEKLVAERLQAELDKAKLSEAERYKLEKEQAEQGARDATAKANARLLAAEAKVQALAAGVDPNYADDVLTLAKISGESFLTDGEPNVTAIRASIDAVLKDRPFYKAGNQQPFGSDGGGNNTTPTGQRDKLQQQIADAYKRGDNVAAIALRDQLFTLEQARG